ncbi:MAG: 4-(cytidine 5'-diphospho)-2-C-methyl-D-erythritol kinase, partial [Ruminiclostridium sp.]|nr:4-(cytidine 5'-diphospho)-2-C-methyl-D-erythritol kinase [Ruminiclostridium sp.]
EKIERIKTALLNAGAKGACMSGSGSAVFGIFDSIEGAGKAAEMLEYGTKFAVKAI